MTFKQKLAQTLISEIQLCSQIAKDHTGEEAVRWRSKVNQCLDIAQTMFGIDSLLDNSTIIKDLEKFTKVRQA
jgi:hypothetical protein